MITISGNNITVTTEEERKALFDIIQNFELKFEHNGEEVLRVEAPDAIVFKETEHPEDVYVRQEKERQEKEYKEKMKKANMKMTEEWLASGGIDLGPCPTPYEPYPEEEDLINKPNHYHKGGIDVYEIAQLKFTPEEYRGFCKGNVLKYILRESEKGGVMDIKKLRFNADRLIENMEGRPYIPEYKRKQSEGVKGQ